MKFPFEELIPYRIAAIIVLAVFFGIPHRIIAGHAMSNGKG